MQLAWNFVAAGGNYGTSCILRNLSPKSYRFWLVLFLNVEEALSLNSENFVPVWMQNRLSRVPTLLPCARPRAKGESPLVALSEAAADWCSDALQDVKGTSSLASRT